VIEKQYNSCRVSFLSQSSDKGKNKIMRLNGLSFVLFVSMHCCCITSQESFSLGGDNIDPGIGCNGAGWYSGTNGKCAWCPKGYYCPEGKTYAMACLAGTYQV
jgi:hypothetical protein